MFERSLFNYEDLEIRISDYANEDILYLLNHTVIGSEGGMRYSLRNIEPRIEGYGDKIRFVSLYKKKLLVGCIGICYRLTGVGRLKAYCSFMRYLAFQSSYQTGMRADGEKRLRDKAEKDGSFKQKILDLFSKPHILNINEVGEKDKHIMYAFVEGTNERSKNLISQAGYELARSFQTVAFSRFSPERHPAVTLLSEEEKPVMTELLTDYYRNYTLFTTEFAFYNNKYYVLKEDGEIKAGVCVIPSEYRVYNIPGVWGWVIMKVLPHVPVYKKLFNPDKFQFLVFEAIYCKEGEEKKLESLFESVCAIEGYNTALTWVDDRSQLFEMLKTKVDTGALGRMLNAKPGLICYRFINFNDEDKDIFYETPAYISAYDFS